MATVYRSHHVDDPAHLAALKVLDADEDLELIAVRMRRFDRELRLLRRLDHRGIVGVHDAGSTPHPWIALELVPGKPLQRVRLGTRGPDEVESLAHQVADALVHAHRVGIFHRDIKPSNILVDALGRAWLVDFGIALDPEEARITDPSGLAPGTLVYAPPEWFRTARLEDPGKGDAYALGVVLWEQLTGHTPFQTPGRSPSLARIYRRKTQLADLDPGAGVSAPFREVVRGLTRQSLDARLTLEEALDRLSRARASRVMQGHGRQTPKPPPPREPGLEPADAFVGRVAEVEAIQRRLADGDRMLSLVGTGGIGKSRLARRIASLLCGLWPGGVVVCDLARVRDVDGLLAVVSRALGLQPTDPIGSALATRGRMLLLLDNAELAAPLEQAAAAALSTWLAEAEELTLLATSRRRLGVSGERVMAVAPLAVPAPRADAAAVAGSDAVRLLVARIRAAEPAFEVTLDNHEAVAELVTAVDGLPLAIELAAARATLLGIDRLTRDGGPFPALLRGTLRCTLDASWEQLKPVEREVLAQCAVFEGGFPLDAAEAVLEPPSGRRLLDVLQHLVDHHLLVVRRREGGFAMLRTVRAYAFEHLQHDPRHRALQQRHASWCAGLAATADWRHGAPPGHQVANARAACAWAIREEQTELAFGAAIVVGSEALRVGPLLPEADLLKRALDLPGGTALGRVRVRVRLALLLEGVLQHAAADEHAQRLRQEVDAVDDLNWAARVWVAAAEVGWQRRADPEPLLAALGQGIAWLREAADERGLAHALVLRSRVRLAADRSRCSVGEDLGRAEALLAGEPDPNLMCRALIARALLNDAPLEEVIRRARRRGLVSLSLEAMLLEGQRLVRRGEWDAAKRALTQAIARSRHHGFVGHEVEGERTMEHVATQLGDVDAARAHARRASHLESRQDRSG
ncbi:MAG: protein kinase [Myxococcales bacterium]|nr:protein kinase [Myxococcales bacterium]